MSSNKEFLESLVDRLYEYIDFYLSTGGLDSRRKWSFHSFRYGDGEFKIYIGDREGDIDYLYVSSDIFFSAPEEWKSKITDVIERKKNERS